MSEASLDSLWLRLLPARARTYIASRRSVAEVLATASWLVADKVVRIGVGVFLNIWIARYLGPAKLGLYSYAQAITVMLSFLSTLGLPDLITRDLARADARTRTVLASAFLLRLGGALAVMAISLGYIMLARPDESGTWLVVVLFASAQLAQAMDVIDTEYQMQARVGAVVMLRNASFILFSLAKIVAIYANGSVTLFALLYALELFVTAGLLWARARREGLGFSLRDATRAELRRLLRDCAPLIIRLGAIGVYLRIDQIMIGRMLGDAAVGVYVAATRLMDPWNITITAAMLALVPRLAQAHHLGNDLYEAQLRKVIRVLVWAAAVMALIIEVIAPTAIHLLYGPRFALAASVLRVHAWAAVFSTAGAAVNAWFINKRLVRYGVYQSIAGALINIVICLLLIPRIGIIGAAVAAATSQFTANILANACFKATRPIFRLQVRAILWL